VAVSKFHTFLVSALDGSEHSVSFFIHFTFRYRAQQTHYTGEQVCSTAGVYILAYQVYQPDAKLHYSDQEQSVGRNAVSFGIYHFGKWKINAAGSSKTFIV